MSDEHNLLHDDAITTHPIPPLPGPMNLLQQRVNCKITSNADTAACFLIIIAAAAAAPSSILAYCAQGKTYVNAYVHLP